MKKKNKKTVCISFVLAFLLSGLSVFPVFAGEVSLETESVITEDAGLETETVLPAVTVLSLENENGVRICWEAVENAAGYRIYRRQKGDSWHRIAQVKNKQAYLDKSCQPGTKYAYLVRAYKYEDGKVILGAADKSPAPVIYYLKAPVLTAAQTTANGKIRISWEASEGASAYDIYSKGPDTEDWIKIGSTKKLTYAAKDLEAGSIYRFSVRARKGLWNSAMSKKGKTAVSLSAPRMKTAVSEDDGIRISWRKTAGADGYRIYRKSAGKSWERIGVSRKTSYLDKNVEDKKTYRYMVQPYTSVGSKKYFGVYDTGRVVRCQFVSPVMQLAEARLKKTGRSLKAAFEWASFIKYDSTQPLASCSADYAKWSFKNGRGFCYGKASAFCYLARALGYDAWVMEGYVKNTSGGLEDHGWVELVYKGETYVCDPSFHGAYSKQGYTGFMIKYGQKNTWQYTNYKQMDP